MIQISIGSCFIDKISLKKSTLKSNANPSDKGRRDKSLALDHKGIGSDYARSFVLVFLGKAYYVNFSTAWLYCL